MYGECADVNHYANQKEVLKELAPKAKDFTNQRAYRNQPLNEQDTRTKHTQSQTRAKVEHPLSLNNPVNTPARRQRAMRVFHKIFLYSPVVLFSFFSSYVMATSQINPTPNLSRHSNAQQPSRGEMRLFVSGHSLVDQPLPDYLEAIGKSLNTPIQWNRHYQVGSSIAARSRGPHSPHGAWDGYRTGANRTGAGMDVVAELRRPVTVSGGHYDALLITEQHALLGTLTWNDTVRYLRHYHERLIEGSPQAKTYFFEPWLRLNDKSDPRRWIAYERAASPIWQCIATRINVSLQAEGRADRISSVPAGIALAHLVDIATRSPGVPAITLSNVRATMDSIVGDDVHLTELGTYYSALVNYAVLYERSPIGAWHPPSVNVAQATALQTVAWEFVTQYAKTNVPLTLTGCTDKLRSEFIGLYWTYVRDTFWRKEGSVNAYWQWAKFMAKWHWRMRKDSAENPFYFDPVEDRKFWLAEP